MLLNTLLMLLCGLLASMSSAISQFNSASTSMSSLWDASSIVTQTTNTTQDIAANQTVPGVQVLTIGYMPGVGAATAETDPITVQDKAFISATPEATFSIPPSTDKGANWSFRISNKFMAEMYRLGNEQCDEAGLSKRQSVNPMRCAPQELRPWQVDILRQGIARAAYQEVTFDKLSFVRFGEYNEEEIRFAAATVLEFAVIERFLETGGILDETLDLEPGEASSWMASALVSQTQSNRYWDFVHATSTAMSTSDGSNATSTTSRICPLCTNAACLVSPDDDQGQDGTNIPTRHALVTGGGDPACVPIQDAQNNNKEWHCLCTNPKKKGKFSSLSTSWTTYLSDRGSTTTLVSAACPRTDLPPPQPPAGPDIVTRTGVPACFPMQDAQNYQGNKWICMCRNSMGRFESHSTSWSTFRLNRGYTTTLASAACPSSEPTASKLPDTQVSKATCSSVKPGVPRTDGAVGAQSTVLVSAISSFCLHYSRLNLHRYTTQRQVGDGPQTHWWNGQTRTQDYTYPTPGVYIHKGKGRTVVVVQLSIKYQVKACDDPKKPVQSAFDKDSGEWCRAEMYRAIQQCHPSRIYGGTGEWYYGGGEVNAGCIQFGVRLTTDDSHGELKMIAPKTSMATLL